MSLGGKNGIFIDWLTASQLHPEGGLPIVSGGVTVHYDASGVARFERNCAASMPGSHDTQVRISCDGFRVCLSGNVGRFSRQDNLFNYGFSGSIEAANRILVCASLPAFTPSKVLPSGEVQRGAVVSRLDLTSNYSTGSESQARALIGWLAARSVARTKKGRAGDESVWWANTRHMLKAYIKHLEMIHHGAAKDEFAVNWCKERGVVRVEIELKKRLLSELELNDIGNITDDKLVALFAEQTNILRSVDRTDEPDILDAVPTRCRMTAAAWMAGQNINALVSRATLFRHAAILREYGIDIMEIRNITNFPVKVRIVDLQPLVVPDWYLERAA